MPTTRDGSALGRMAVRVAAWEAAAASERPRWRAGRAVGKARRASSTARSRPVRIDRRCLGRRHLFVAARRRGGGKGEEAAALEPFPRHDADRIGRVCGVRQPEARLRRRLLRRWQRHRVFAGVGITVIIVGEWPSGPTPRGLPRSGFPLPPGLPPPLPPHRPRRRPPAPRPRASSARCALAAVATPLGCGGRPPRKLAPTWSLAACRRRRSLAPVESRASRARSRAASRPQSRRAQSGRRSCGQRQATPSSHPTAATRSPPRGPPPSARSLDPT